MAQGESDRPAPGSRKRLFRRVLTFAAPYRRRLAVSVGLLLLLAGLTMLAPWIVRRTIDRWLPGGKAVATALSTEEARTGVLNAALLLLAIGLVVVMLRYLQLVLINRTGQKVIHDLRLAVFRHITTRSLRFFDSNPVGKLVTRATNDVEALNELFTSGIDVLFYDILRIAIIVTIVFVVDWRLALAALSVIPLLALWSWRFQNSARKLFRVVREKVTGLNTFMNESLTGIRVIQAFRREQLMKSRFDDANSSLREAHLATVKNYSLFYPGMEFLTSLGTVGIAIVGNELFLDGAIERGVLVYFFMLFNMFVEPLRQLADKINVLQAALAAGERIFKVLDDDTAIAVKPAPIALPKLTGAVRFENVSFGYDARKPVLKNVDFEARPGNRIAIVGPTGSGKTTIVSLLLRFYDPNAGRILLDGIDLRDLDPATLRRRIGVVLQDVFLFAGSVRENFILGDESISDERIMSAAAAAQASGVIERLGGLSAQIMERGAALSAGERQLLAFARTLVHDPALLVLDEATANIDTESERLIQQALDRILVGRTSIIVAHRLSTIRRADRILVVHHGEIREAGTHAELIELGGLYARLHRLQFKA